MNVAAAWISGSLLIAAGIFGVWASIDIYRMSRFSKRVRAWGNRYAKARVALMCGDYESEAFQWATRHEPEPVYHHTWPLHRVTL